MCYLARGCPPRRLAASPPRRLAASPPHCAPPPHRLPPPHPSGAACTRAMRHRPYTMLHHPFRPPRSLNPHALPTGDELDESPYLAGEELDDQLVCTGARRRQAQVRGFRCPRRGDRLREVASQSAHCSLLEAQANAIAAGKVGQGQAELSMLRRIGLGFGRTGTWGLGLGRLGDSGERCQCGVYRRAAHPPVTCPEVSSSWTLAPTRHRIVHVFDH